MKAKSRYTLPGKRWLLILSIVCVILMVTTLLSSVFGGPFRFVANYTVIPMQKGLNYVGMWMTDVSSNFETLQDMRNENKKLQQQVDNLTIEKNQLQQDSAELERLQTLYKLDQNYSDYKKVGAHVIASGGTNWFRTFTIDKGSSDGMKKNQNVMAGSGLVGIITEVGAHSSKVRSIIDDGNNVSGMILTTADTCMVTGDLTLMQDGEIKFSQLANNDNKIKLGEQIVTSHISDKYVQGLLIGSVSKIKEDDNGLTRSGYLIPAVDFQHLQEVLVITTTKEDLINK